MCSVLGSEHFTLREKLTYHNMLKTGISIMRDFGGGKENGMVEVSGGV